MVMSVAPRAGAPDKLSEGRKNDSGKLRFSLVPQQALWAIVKVLEHGAAKYEEHNWRKVSNWRERYFNASMRHLAAWFRGEWSDPESGLPHLAHAGCCILFLLAMELDERGEK